MSQDAIYKNFEDHFQDDLRLQVMFIKDPKTGAGEPIASHVKLEKLKE